MLFAPYPWFGVAGLGILFGRLLVSKGREVFESLLPVGLGLFALFAFLRLSTDHFGNLQILPIKEWWSFFYIIKYPPSMAFISLTLGIGFLILHSFYRLGSSRIVSWLTPFEILGTSALFFYFAHLIIYAFLGFFIRAETIPFSGPYLGWLLGLLILVPLCKKYGQFKAGKPTESIWRMF